MSGYFKIEKIFFESYINILSSDSFRVLLKMLYLSRNTNRNVNIKSMKSMRRMIGLNAFFADSIWNQLIENDFIVKSEFDNRIIYTLNGEKIYQDNVQYGDDCDIPRNISITIFNSEQKFTNVISLSDDEIKEKIIDVFDTVSDTLMLTLLKTINLLKKYYVDKEKRFKMVHLSELLTQLVKYDSSILERACKKFNLDKRIAGSRCIKYFLKIVESSSNGESTVVNNLIDNDVVEKVISKRKQEGELKFALKLATGDVNGNYIYNKLVKSNSFEKLTELWELGKNTLIDNNESHKLFTDYKWLVI